MPEGETPQTVSMCTWMDMVDVCKPGDRVEITGIYRASPVRFNPRHRTVRSIYKTYVDIVHGEPPPPSPLVSFYTIFQ